MADTVGGFHRPGPEEIELTSAYLLCVTYKKESSSCMHRRKEKGGLENR